MHVVFDTLDAEPDFSAGLDTDEQAVFGEADSDRVASCVVQVIMETMEKIDCSESELFKSMNDFAEDEPHKESLEYIKVRLEQRSSLQLELHSLIEVFHAFNAEHYTGHNDARARLRSDYLNWIEKPSSTRFSLMNQREAMMRIKGMEGAVYAREVDNA